MGNGEETNLIEGNAFLTQLTAAYVMSRIEAHYQEENPNVRGLFYTLGFNIGSNRVAQSVMNPNESTWTDALWTSYNALTTGSLSVRVKGHSTFTSYTDVTISKNSYVTSQSYVDEYFPASSNGLETAFQAIVDEIIIQSRYYPTHLEGGSPDFSGYVEFTDIIGEYMEVKDVKGILLGETLFDGHMVASKMTSNEEGGLGTVENPTALGNEFIRSVKTRLGIADTATAQALVARAYATGQLKYNSATDWSNYIGWYAKADGTYVGFWNEGETSVPENAVYKVKSYGFLGQTTGSIKNSDMMYMSVQVRTDIATGGQTVLWRIPAALIPLITYSVTLEGTNVDEARNVQLSVEDKDNISPIRLIFESGLRSDLNELNISRITDEKHITEDGVTRRFWTNYFDITPEGYDNDTTTIAEFTPSKENERFYYTFDSAVHKKVGDSYVLVEENEGVSGALNPDETYYHRRYIFTDDSTMPVFLYEEMSDASIGEAKWKADFVTKTGEIGAWVVPSGTPARELKIYDEKKSTTDNIDTLSADNVFHPYLTEYNNMYYVDMNLGNNGLLEVTPAQGLKLSKTVDVYETGTSTNFKFLITIKNANGTPYTGALSSWITDFNVVPLGEATQITMSATGTYTVDLAADQTFWLTGIPTGATYTIEEVSTNEDYKVKSVHVNGISTRTAAAGTVAAYYIDNVEFVNTAVGEGDLVITKQVVNENGIVVDISDDIIFTAVVALTDASNNPVSGRFEASNAAGYIDVPANGQFTVKLHDGESFVVRNIPEETKYTVDEINIPNGFAINGESSILKGVVDSATNDQALIVNTYNPTGTNGRNVTIDVTKLITGNRDTWLTGESYTFEVKSLSVTRAAENSIATFTIDANDADKKYTLTLSGEDYLEAGTYYYSITEVKGNNGGITYDTAERRFAVVVADADMDGDLEITAVNNEINTTVTTSGSNYTVAAAFNNVYQPTGSAFVTINVVKKMEGEYRRNGFQFALYDSADLENAAEIARSTVTDALGNANFTLTYAPNRATIEGAVYTYYLAELDTGNPNITYDEAIYEVKVTIKDNGDGTISATPVITSYSNGKMEEGKPTFTNVFKPSDSAYVTLTANKTITGDRVLNTNEFEFVIEAIDGAPLPANTTVKNAANGAVVFDAIEFTAEGEYKYKIYESSTNPIGGFTYDGRYYEVTVNVTDNGNQKLLASVTRVVKENESDAGHQLADDEIISFENAYKAKPVDVILSGEKFLTGKTLTDEFSFTIKPTGTTTLPAGYTDTVNNAGTAITFGTLTYDKAGVYTYTITENGEDNANYDYDESVYEITVTVTDNSRGILSAKVKMTKNGMDATAIVFRNGFVPTPITFDIYDSFGGKKVLTGRDIQESEFEFQLINAINGVQIGETVRNDASGAFKFPAVTIPEAGNYRYKITEVIGDERGITYDISSVHVVLEVVQDDAGALSIASKALYKGTVTKEEVDGVITEVTQYEDITDNGEIVFVNQYSPDPGNIELGGVKHLKGRTLKAGEFTFNLYFANLNDEGQWEKGELVEQVTNNADGTFSFETRMAELGATYIYFITEDATDPDETITYDTAEYMVVVTSTDNLDGTMTVNYAYTIDGEEAEGVSFTNTYTAPPEEPDKTGDDMNLWLGSTAMLTSCACLVVLVMSQKKKFE